MAAANLSMIGAIAVTEASEEEIGKMTMHASIRGSVVSAVLADYERNGGNPGSLMFRHGLTAKLLADPHASIPLTRYVAMFEDMAEMIADPLLGARIGMEVRPADLGPVGLIMERSASIAAALKRLTRFVNSLQPGTNATLHDADALLVWTYRLNDPAIWPRRQDAEFTVSSLVRLVRTAFGAGLRPVQAQFEHAPPTAAIGQALERLLGCPIRFEAASNGVMFLAEEAHRQRREEDRDIIAVLERYLIDLLPMPSSNESWRDRVGSLVSSYLGEQLITINRVANDLAISPRSLQRRLAAEGTSLRELIRTHRQELAAHRLQNRAAHLGRLAETLGYADGTAFWRAHRQWTGKPPSAARSQRDG